MLCDPASNAAAHREADVVVGIGWHAQHSAGHHQAAVVLLDQHNGRMFRPRNVGQQLERRIEQGVKIERAAYFS